MPPKIQMVGQDGLFPSEEFESGSPARHKPLSARLWTQNKAQLIARYLHEFVFVTKHGTYIDLFAGRQSDEVKQSWSVQEVLTQQPNSFKLRHYRLFEMDVAKVTALEALCTEYPGVDMTVTAGDSNDRVRAVLPAGSIAQKEATFCLIDQRTTECKWSTVDHLANLKSGGYKPELFYFLAQGWLNRALLTRTRDDSLQKTTDWWGSADWKRLVELSSLERAVEVAHRFQDEFGYRHATPWPIYGRKGGKQIMFHMIHATDHDRAPGLMRRAYEWAVAPIVNPGDEQQLAIDLDELNS